MTPFLPLLEKRKWALKKLLSSILLDLWSAHGPGLCSAMLLTCDRWQDEGLFLQLIKASHSPHLCSYNRANVSSRPGTGDALCLTSGRAQMRLLLLTTQLV